MFDPFAIRKLLVTQKRHRKDYQDKQFKKTKTNKIPLGVDKIGKKQKAAPMFRGFPKRHPLIYGKYL